jgi:hypothetical protein
MALYGGKATSRTLSKSAQPTRAAKQPWKADWESSPEYQAWDSYKTPGGKVSLDTAHKEQYAALQAAAFRRRDEIRRGGSTAGGAQSAPAAADQSQ